MTFENKVIIITGGSEGCGAATARLFAEASANLLLVARNQEKLECIANNLRQKTRVEIFPMNVAGTDALRNVFEFAIKKFGRIDILINNAGFHQRGPFEMVSAEDHAVMVDVNLRAPILMSCLALPYFRANNEGIIINVGSLAGWQPLPNQVSYSATKAGLRTFTYALHEELRNTNIKIAIVSPGPLDTGFIMSNLESVADLTLSQPISTSEDVAKSIIKLCTNRKTEIAIPKVSAALSRFFIALPWLKRPFMPILEAKGRRTKQKLKAAKEE